jgi:hypothetical protein
MIFKYGKRFRYAPSFNNVTHKIEHKSTNLAIYVLFFFNFKNKLNLGSAECQITKSNISFYDQFNLPDYIHPICKFHNPLDSNVHDKYNSSQY